MSFSPLSPEPASRGLTDDFNIQEMIAALRARTWLIVSIVGLSLLGAAYYCVTAPKIYSSTTRIQVDQRTDMVVKIQDVRQEDLHGEAMLNTIAQSMSSRPLLRMVAKANDLTHRPDFLPGNKGPMPSEDELAGMLMGMVEVRVVKDTRLVDVSVEHENPRLAQKLASSVVEEYIHQTLETRTQTSDIAREFLEKQVREAKERVDKSKKLLQAYAEENGSVSLGGDQNNIVLEKLKELNTRLTDVRSQRARLEADVANLRQVGNDPEKMLAVPSVAASNSVADLRRSVSAQEVEITTLSERYRAKHPEMISARSKLETLQTKLREAILRSPSQIAAAYSVAQETERTFQGELDQLEKSVLGVKGKAIQYQSMSRDVETDEALYTSLLQRLKETGVTGDLAPVNIRVIDPAEPAGAPVKPAKAKILLLTLVASLTLSGALAIGLNALDNSIKTTDQAERSLGLPVVAAVPLGRKIRKGDRPLVADLLPSDPISEAFRTLRTSLLLSGQKGDLRACGFTSSVAGEGKSFCSANYAVTLAQQGLRTLVIDADLRRPMVTQFFKISPVLPGVTEVLTGQRSFEEALAETEIDNLWVLPVGSIPTTPAELLSGPGFGEIMKLALAKFDRVVVDTAPVNLVSDTLLIAKTLQRICLVVQAGVTPVKVARHALGNIATTGAQLSGIILNRLQHSQVGGYYYSYTSDKVYGSESVYGASSRKTAQKANL